MEDKIEPTLNNVVDLIKQPPHYTSGGIEPIDYIVRNDLDFLEGNVIKYVTRYPFKGTPVADLHKARFYLDLLIQRTEFNHKDEREPNT
jgi:hypothetical protein